MKRLSAAKAGIPYCYILECSDGSYYTGWTNNLPRRIREHAAGRGGRYTRTHRPVKLVYFERQEDARAARRREAKIKGLPRPKKKEMAEGNKVPKAAGRLSGRKPPRRRKRPLSRPSAETPSPTRVAPRRNPAGRIPPAGSSG